MKIVRNMIIAVATISPIVNGCTSKDSVAIDDDAISSESSVIWNDASLNGELYVLGPGQAEFDGSPPSAVASFLASTITTELDLLLRSINSLTQGDGPFPACTPEPNQQIFYLVVIDEIGTVSRYPQQNDCALGYGLSGGLGFFEQDISGVLSIVDMCSIGDIFGVATAECL